MDLTCKDFSWGPQYSQHTARLSLCFLLHVNNNNRSFEGLPEAGKQITTWIPTDSLAVRADSKKDKYF